MSRSTRCAVPEGCFHVRLGRRGRPGDRRRRRRHQLLDLRRRRPLRRPGRAGLPRRLRRRGVRGRRPPATTARTPARSTTTARGSDGGGVHPDADLPLHGEPQRRRRRAAGVRRHHHLGHRHPAAGGRGLAPRPTATPAAHAPAPAGLFTGKIVACERGPGRVSRGFNVFQGGAAGMILYNADPSDVMTDNHWLPTVHIDSPRATSCWRSWRPTRARPGPSRRAPGPPGRATVCVLLLPRSRAATGSSRTSPRPACRSWPATPRPRRTRPAARRATCSRPSRAPRCRRRTCAGAAALLVAACIPTGRPGQIKSALETTAKTAGVTKTDRVTPADPFDVGGGRVDLTRAGDPGLTFDETAANFAALAGARGPDRPQHRLGQRADHAGRDHHHPHGHERHQRASPATASPPPAPAGTRSRVRPSRSSLPPGRTVTSTITISAPVGAAGPVLRPRSTSTRRGSRVTCTCRSRSSSGQGA